MKTSAILRIVLWSIVALLLLGLLICGIVGVPIFGGLSFGGFSYENSELYSVGPGSADPAQVQELEVHWISGDVRISLYDGETVQFSETADRALEEKEQLHYLLRDGKLILQFRASQAFGFALRSSLQKSLEIRLPRSMAETLRRLSADSVAASIALEEGVSAQTVELESVSGGVTLSGTQAARLSVETVSGSVNATDVTADTVETEAISGTVRLAGSFGSLQQESVSGEIEVRTSTPLRSFDAETVSGNIRLTLPEGGGFTAQHDSVSGDFICDFAVQSREDQATYLDGSADIRMETVSGDMHLLRG